jgi:hypothetical protein
MKTQCKLALVLCGFSPFSVCAATHYVWQSSPGPAPPFLTWATAATNIQDAVDAAVAGDEIVVTNGTYAGGNRVEYSWPGWPNRVVVDKPLVLRSVSGPDVTVIDGSGSVRCLYLTADAVVVEGFTLTNGYAGNGGGVYCESASAVLSNCVLTGNSANGYYDSYRDYVGGVGGGAYNATLNNCTLTGNSAEEYGGGASFCTLNNCTLTGNSACYGGGAYTEWSDSYVLKNCTLTANSAWYGGGAYGGTLDNCTLTGNSAWEGGGAYAGTSSNCTLTGNSAWYGGGAFGGTLNNCTLTGNTVNGHYSSAWRCYSPGLGGGAADCTLNNCTLSGNSANGAYLPDFGYVGGDGGGAYSCTLNNCIVYFNPDPLGGNYDASSTLNYCCTTPMPTNGVGNIAVDPQLASASHLSAESPCIGAGNARYASGTDIDGEAWANPP